MYVLTLQFQMQKAVGKNVTLYAHMQGCDGAASAEPFVKTTIRPISPNHLPAY